MPSQPEEAEESPQYDDGTLRQMERDLDVNSRKLGQVTAILERVSASQSSGVIVVIPRSKMEPT
eukprot:762638-Prorocentrum_lima.AAC.1